MDIAFVLTRSAAKLKPKAVIESARRLGFTLTHEGSTKDEARGGVQIDQFNGPGEVCMFVALMPLPHPDVPGMPTGPTSPKPEALAAAKAHLIITIQGLEGPDRERDAEAAALATSVIENVDAVGAMLGHGVVFHEAKAFADLAALGREEGVLPPEIAVDVTAARQSATTMSFLTHGMQRYGREEIWVTCPIAGKGAAGFVYGLVRWLLTDLDKQLPTGDTIGRTASEKVPIERVPNPTGKGPEVIWLDLP
jgi:hypothetical protein